MRPECRERFPRHLLQRKPLVNDPGMHHGTCVTHVPWCMSGSLTRGGGENVPGISGACATRHFRYLIRCLCLKQQGHSKFTMIGHNLKECHRMKVCIRHCVVVLNNHDLSQISLQNANLNENDSEPNHQILHTGHMCEWYPITLIQCASWKNVKSNNIFFLKCICTIFVCLLIMMTLECMSLLTCSVFDWFCEITYNGTPCPWWRHQTETFSVLLAICAGKVNSPHKSQWRVALMFSLICARINGWVNNGEAGDLRRHHAYHGVTVMTKSSLSITDDLW